MKRISSEQAVFTSSDRGPIRGYQLVAKSSGIDRDLSQELCRWAPTRTACETPDDWTLNCFPATDDLVAVTRTTMGGPEYSGRGGTQVVTLMLVLCAEELESYDFNPVSFARTAMAMGCLRLPLDWEAELLSPVSLPAYPLVGEVGRRSESHSCDEHEWLSQVTSLLEEGRRVAVVGPIDPFAAADRVIRNLPVHRRPNLSFTTGLEPSIRRPFQLHFFESVDSTRQRALDSQNIACVSVSA
ncbi:MAG: hypothetical protein ACO1RT_00380 [Planctomycetaceae bacterium]